MSPSWLHAERSRISATSRSARSAGWTAVPKCSNNDPSGSRKSYRGGVGLTLTTRTSFPFCRSSPAMPTSEPRASPSGRTCVVTRKRSWVSIRSASGVQSIIMRIPGRGAGRSRRMLFQVTPHRFGVAIPAVFRPCWPALRNDLNRPDAFRSCKSRSGTARCARGSRRWFLPDPDRGCTEVSSSRATGPARCRRAGARPRWPRDGGGRSRIRR